ncbi:MAG: hypothetical protein ACLGI2_13900 [Acidimicrobiia bacterium]
MTAAAVSRPEGDAPSAPTGQARPSRLAVGLAVGASAVVGVAAATGYTFAGPEMAGGVAVAGTIAVLNYRARPKAEPHVLKAVPHDTAAARIGAPRAATLAAAPVAAPAADAA